MKTLFITLIVILLTLPAFAQQNRNIVVEDHTGAWCGWCVIGIEKLEELHAKYGDQIIPIAVHNGDSMTIGAQKEIASKLGITGYPTGTFNRESMMYNGKSSTLFHPSDWLDAVPAVLNQQPVVSVALDVTKDGNTLTATVTATALRATEKQLAFNFAVMEDHVTGSGKGWDQTNYLANSKGYEDSRFFYEPPTIKNFYHDNVLRTLAGGSFGTTGSFPASLAYGEKYTHTFTVDLAVLPIQNPDNLWFAAYVQGTDADYSIYNAVSKNKKPTVITRRVFVGEILSTEVFKRTTNMAVASQKFSVKNTYDLPMTVEFSVIPDETYATSGWRYHLSDTVAMLKPGEYKEVTVTTMPNGTEGFSLVKVQSRVLPSKDYLGAAKSEYFSVVSDGVRKCVLRPEGLDMKPFLASLSEIPAVSSDYAIIPGLNKFVLSSGLEQFDLIIWPGNYPTRDRIAVYGDTIVPMFAQHIATGKSLLITSPMDLWFIADNYGSIAKPQVKSFFKETLGITNVRFAWNNDNVGILWRFAGGGYNPLNVEGVAGEKITQNLKILVNDTVGKYPYGTAWVDMIKPLDASKAQTILRYNHPRYGKDSSNAAVKIQVGNARAIYQGFGFDCIADEPVRRTLLANYIAWLLRDPSGVAEPSNLNSAGLTIRHLPGANTATLNIAKGLDLSADISLVNAAGKLVTSLHKGTLNTPEITFDVTGLHSGVYYVLANIGGVISTTGFPLAR